MAEMTTGIPPSHFWFICRPKNSGPSQQIFGSDQPSRNSPVCEDRPLVRTPNLQTQRPKKISYKCKTISSLDLNECIHLTITNINGYNGVFHFVVTLTSITSSVQLNETPQRISCTELSSGDSEGGHRFLPWNIEPKFFYRYDVDVQCGNHGDDCH